MTDFNGIIDKAIELVSLERDLGARCFEIDRSLLEVDDSIESAATLPQAQHKPTEVVREGEKEPQVEVKIAQVEIKEPTKREVAKTYDFIFLHDKPLSPASEVFMLKALSGLGVTKEDAPIITEKPLPQALVYVVLGLKTLKKFAPGVSVTMGAVSTSPGGKRMVLTHSPEEMARFASVTTAVNEMKKITWLGFKRAAAEAVRLKKEGA